MRIVKSLLLLVGASAAFAPAQVGGETGGPLLVGYAVITPQPPSSASQVSAFETFGLQNGNSINQAGVLPSTLEITGILPITTNPELSRDLGIAMVNLNDRVAHVTLTLRDANGGSAASPQPVTIDPFHQISRFAGQLFPSLGSISNFMGTVEFQSDVPIAAVGLRFQGTNFSTIPVIPVGPVVDVPALPGGIGGSGSFVLPQFAVGQGWASQIQVVNSSPTQTLTVRIDLFDQNGMSLSANLNGQTSSSFQNISIPPNGIFTLSSLSSTGSTPF